MTIMDLYNNGHRLPTNELIEIAKGQIGVIMRERAADPYRAKCYIDNIFQTFMIASGDPTFDAYRFYDACGANHKRYDYSAFVEWCRQAQRIDFISIIADHFHEETKAVQLAVCALAVLACVCDGKVNRAEHA